VYTNSLLAALNMRPFFAGQHRDNSRSEPEAFVLSPRSGSFPGSPGVRLIEPADRHRARSESHRLPRCLYGSTSTLRRPLIRKAPSRRDRDAAYHKFEYTRNGTMALDAKCYVAQYPFTRCKYCWVMNPEATASPRLGVFSPTTDVIRCASGSTSGLHRCARGLWGNVGTPCRISTSPTR
jgi:hypothetical protein